jgi:uncharacterized LabA/DUF88 family protein
VTTQNTEPENNDINETVVQQQSASETPITSAETEVGMPANEQDTQTHEIQLNPSDKQIEEEPVRSFTDYIEEFRQNEVQFSSPLEEPQVEPFSALIPGEDTGRNEFAPEWINTPLGDNILLEGTPIIVEDGETHSDIHTIFPVGEIGNGVENPSELQVQPAVETEAALPSVDQTSPLVRPSSRARLPRQVGIRHREEPVVDKQAQQEQGSEAATGIMPSVEDTGNKDETPVVEKPRPERRYRFDRRTPAASNTATATHPRTDESRGNTTTSQGFQRTNNEHPGDREEQVAQLSDVAHSTEQITSTQEPVQEQMVAPTVESAKAKPTRTTHDARRRHGQERQREKVQATPSAPIPVTPEDTAPVAEIVEPQVPEVALEDLPPLEYAELQAASSRRRRKRRSGSSSQTTNASANSVVAKPVTPEQALTGTQLASSPVSPPATATRAITASGSPVLSANQYSIQSGHTVSQMNQGNDESGPFMGPEPSPARGSGSSIPRNVRPIRNDVQRVPTYPIRSEGAASSASINHLANVVAQAIQTQSDRMVAELRRANQIPTNVSVSLPPFPSTERVGVFVDVANLLYSARTQRLTIDFGKLLDFLRGNRRLVRAHAYCPTSPQPGDDQMFLQAVKGLGYRITTKNYKTFSSGAKKADLDLDLCMDVVRLVDGGAVDCIVLVSGDSDFMPMLDYCSDHGVRVEVAAFDESMSATLRQSCDLFINLSMLDEIRA